MFIEWLLSFKAGQIKRVRPSSM